jgi:hypothetical protein
MSQRMKIEVITCPRGDWKVLLVDGKIEHEGHNIPDSVWLDLFFHCVSVEEIITTEISDKDMEEGKYYGTK